MQRSQCHLLTIFLFLVTQSVSGQWTYITTYMSDAGNPGNVNTEGDAPGLLSWNVIVTGPQNVNSWSPAIQIPFTFDFFGTPVTHCKASQNGLVTFDTMATALPSTNENLPSINLPDKTICAFWDAFTSAPPTGSGDDIRTKTFGTAPNRQFWIKWYSFEYGNPVSSFNYFAVVLEESTHKIYIVDQYSIPTSLTATVGIQLDQTTSLQIGDNMVNHEANESVITDNDFYTFDPFLITPDDAGISAVLNPTIPALPGLYNLELELRNFGNNVLNNATVQWSVNGLMPGPVSFNGSVAPGATTSISMGSVTLTDFLNIKAWSELPNGVPDNYPPNDTITAFLCARLSGVYSVGGPGADFMDLRTAVDILLTCGVAAPVTFNLSPGEHDGGIEIRPVLGASAINTITFDGGDAEITKIIHDGTGQYGVIELHGADHITIQNLTLENTAIQNGWGVWLGDTADYNTIHGCQILLDPAGTTNMVGVSASGNPLNDFAEGNAGNHLTIEDCLIQGGEMGIHLEGQNLNWIRDIHIINNTLTQMDDYGIYIDDIDSLTIEGNRILDLRSIGGDGLYCFDIQNFDITANQIEVPDYGLYVSDGNFDAPIPSGRSFIINNMVLSKTDYAIYLDDINNIDIFHNTAKGNPGIRINDFTGMDIRNNIFASGQDYAFESDDAYTGIIDYNLYYPSPLNSFFVKDGPSTYADLAAWQAATSFNVNSLEGNPFFISESDLHVLGIVANDTGDNTAGVVTDIDGESRPISPSSTVDIGADEYTPNQLDALVHQIVPTSNFCGETDMMVEVFIGSLGQSPINNFPVTLEISGNYQYTSTQNMSDLLMFNDTSSILFGPFNMEGGGLLNFKAYTGLSGDQRNINDTLSLNRTFQSILPSPVEVSITNCNTYLLEINTTSNVSWTDQALGGSVLGMGPSLMIDIDNDSTVFANLTSSSDSITTTFAGGNGCAGGNMFDVTSITGATLTGFTISPNPAAGISTPINVYYIPQSSYQGFELNGPAWTLHHQTTIVSQGDGIPVRFDIPPLTIPAGDSMAIYIGADLNYTSASNTYSNADLIVQTGLGLCNLFSGPNPSRDFNGRIHYNKGCFDGQIPVMLEYPPLMILDADPLESKTYFSGGSITSVGRVPGDGTVTFQAAEFIELVPEFRVEQGGIFTAVIGDCN